MFAAVEDSLLGSSVVLSSFAFGLNVCGAYFKQKNFSNASSRWGKKMYKENFKSLKKQTKTKAHQTKLGITNLIMVILALVLLYMRHVELQ